MSGSRWAVVAAAVMASVSLAGCVGGFGGESLDAFDPIPVPKWEAGHWWAYDVAMTSQHSYTFGGEQFEQGPYEQLEEVTVRVFNTTQPLNGESVYYVRNDNPVDSPLLEASVQALTKDSLVLAGVGHSPMYGVAVPEPMPMPAAEPTYASSELTYSQPESAPQDPCAGRHPLDPVPATDRFEQFQFPLDDGAQWTGIWAIPAGDAQVRYTAVVDGMERVVTPAGAFDAARTTIDMVPAVPIQDQDVIFDARIRVQNWYAPEVQYIVKSVTETKVKAVGPGGESFRAEFRSMQELRDWSLEEGAPEPAPFVRKTEFPAGVDETFRIVSDTPPGVNVAEGPHKVRFLLEDTTAGSSRFSYPITAEPDADPYNPGGRDYEVVWRLSWSHGHMWQVNDTLDAVIDKASPYSVTADLRPVDCGLPRMESAYGEFPVTWERTFLVEPTPLDDSPVSLATVEVLGYAREATAQWTWIPSLGVQVDDGHPRVAGPGQATYTGFETGANEVAFDLYPGSWTLEWVPESPPVGDRVAVTFRFAFGNTYSH